MRRFAPPPCALPNRCAPTCACRQYGVTGEPKKMSTGMKLLGAFTLGSIALLFAGAFAADTYHERRLREQEQRYRR